MSDKTAKVVTILAITAMFLGHILAASIEPDPPKPEKEKKPSIINHDDWFNQRTKRHSPSSAP